MFCSCSGDRARRGRRRGHARRGRRRRERASCRRRAPERLADPLPADRPVGRADVEALRLPARASAATGWRTWTTPSAGSAPSSPSGTRGSPSWRPRWPARRRPVAAPRPASSKPAAEDAPVTEGAAATPGPDGGAALPLGPVHRGLRRRTTTRSGAARSTATTPCSSGSAWRRSSPACPGSRSCAAARASAAAFAGFKIADGGRRSPTPTRNGSSPTPGIIRNRAKIDATLANARGAGRLAGRASWTR